MRNPERIEPFLEEVKRQWLLRSDYRFGQLLVNMLGGINQDPFFIEDDKLLEHFKNYHDMWG